MIFWWWLTPNCRQCGSAYSLAKLAFPMVESFVIYKHGWWNMSRPKFSEMESTGRVFLKITKYLEYTETGSFNLVGSLLTFLFIWMQYYPAFLCLIELGILSARIGEFCNTVIGRAFRMQVHICCCYSDDTRIVIHDICVWAPFQKIVVVLSKVR